MANCDICGKNVDKPIQTLIEGTKMGVCSDCSKHGEILGNSRNENRTQFKKKFIKEDEEERIINNYSQIIKNAREQMNLKQEELAKKISEKESLIHQIESGHLVPQITTIKKLENFFGIKLLEKINPSSINYNKENKEEDGNLTIGDLIKNKINLQK